MKIATSLAAKSNKGSFSIRDLCRWARILKVNDTQEAIGEINKEVYATAGNEDQLPIEIPAEILESYRTIDSLNIADGEVLVYEVMLNNEDDSELPYCLKPVKEEKKGTSVKKSNNQKLKDMHKSQQAQEEEERKRMDSSLTEYLKVGK
jgi:hypothetical protein